MVDGAKKHALPKGTPKQEEVARILTKAGFTPVFAGG